jgi:hypothetical protein
VTSVTNKYPAQAIALTKNPPASKYSFSLILSPNLLIRYIKSVDDSIKIAHERLTASILLSISWT